MCFGCVFVFWLCISGRMCTFSGKGTAVCTDKSTHGRDSGSSGQATSSPHSSRWEFDRGDLGGLSPVWYTGLRWDHIRSHVFVKVVGCHRPVCSAGVARVSSAWGSMLASAGSTSKKKKQEKEKNDPHRERGALEIAGPIAYATFAARLIRHCNEVTHR